MTVLANRSGRHEGGPEVPDDTSPFVPVAEVARYAAPKATIDPDGSKTWLRRAMPIMKAHRGIFITALVMSFVGLVLQVQIPDLLNKAINNSIQHHVVPLSYYVWWVIGLGVLGAVSGYISRLFLFKTAYNIEFDLRNIIYEHLTKMSFGFYDRVQSGQLISRANSDIRSVQMYMTFAPMILVQCGIAVVAFGYMLSINVLLAFIAMATMPFVYLVGVKMRKSMFPVSWLIQARLADVATIVDENVNGVRVVKSFAAEPTQLRALAKSADKVQWGYIKDADLRSRFAPAIQNLPQVGLALVLLFGGYMVIHGHLQLGAILAFNAYLLMLQAPFMMLGHDHHDGPAGGRLGRPDLRDPRRAFDGRRPPRCGGPGRVRRRRPLRGRRFLLRRRDRAQGARPSRPAPEPRRDGGHGRADRDRQIDGGPPAHPLLRRHRGPDPDR